MSGNWFYVPEGQGGLAVPVDLVDLVVVVADVVEAVRGDIVVVVAEVAERMEILACVMVQFVHRVAVASLE